LVRSGFGVFVSRVFVEFAGDSLHSRAIRCIRWIRGRFVAFAGFAGISLDSRAIRCIRGRFVGFVSDSLRLMIRCNESDDSRITRFARAQYMLSLPAVILFVFDEDTFP